MGDLLQGFVNGLFGTSQANLTIQLGHLAATVFLVFVIAIITLFFAVRVRDMVFRSLKGRQTDPSTSILVGRVIFFAILIFGLILVLRTMGLDATVLVASFGILSLTISLALQDILKNIVAGVYLLIERPFRPGETIKIRDFVGVVESIELRTTTLRDEDTLVHVPNAILFAEILTNRGVPPVGSEETVE